MFKDIENAAIKFEKSINSKKTNKYKTTNLFRMTENYILHFDCCVRNSIFDELQFIVKKNKIFFAFLLLNKQVEIDKLKKVIRCKNALLDKTKKLIRNLNFCFAITSRITITFSKIMYFAENDFNLSKIYATDHNTIILKMKTRYEEFFRRYVHNLLFQTRISITRLWMKNETFSNLKIFCEKNEQRFFDIETLFESEKFTSKWWVWKLLNEVLRCERLDLKLWAVAKIRDYLKNLFTRFKATSKFFCQDYEQMKAHVFLFL